MQYTYNTHTQERGGVDIYNLKAHDILSREVIKYLYKNINHLHELV